MRKTFLQNEKKEAQRKKFIVIGIGVLLIGIMIFSTLGYVFDYSNSNSANTVKEYGQKFSSVQTQSGSYWQTSLNDVKRQFLRLPTQVAYVEVTPQAATTLALVPQVQAFVLAVNPNTPFSQISFATASFILGDLYDEKKQILPAITDINESVTSIPVISCDNQSYFDPQNLSGQIPIIQVQESNQTMIRVQNNCIIIEGSDAEGIISAVERFRYGMWGIDFTKNPVDE